LLFDVGGARNKKKKTLDLREFTGSKSLKLLLGTRAGAIHAPHLHSLKQQREVSKELQLKRGLLYAP